MFLLPGVSIPDTEQSFFSNVCHSGTIWAKDNTQSKLRVIPEQCKVPARLYIPKADGAVKAAADQLAAVGAKGNRSDLIRMPFQGVK